MEKLEKKPPSKAELKKIAIAFAKELMDKRAGLDTFGFVYEDGKTEKRSSQPCYAEVRRSGMEGRIAFFVFSHDMKNVVRTPEIDKYIRYIITRSPYKDGFILKSVGPCWTRAHIIEANRTPQEIIGAAILLRYLTEMPSKIQLWNSFVKGGMSEDLALVLIHMCKRTSADTFNKSLDIGGHTTICHYDFSKIGLQNLLLRNKVVKVDKMSEGNTNYQYLTSIWTGKNTGYGCNLSDAELLSFPKNTSDATTTDAFGCKIVKSVYTFENGKDFEKQFLKLNGVNVNGEE